MTDYKAWWMAVKAFNAWYKLDDMVYEYAKDKGYHDNVTNPIVCEGIDAHYDLLLFILSDGKERSYWDFYDRFGTPGGDNGKTKPVAWDSSSSAGFMPEKLEKLFRIPERRGFILAKDIYDRMIKLEADYEAKTTGTKIPRRKSKTA